MSTQGTATAIAHPNIALIKYWGKRDSAQNLPAVGSLSVTLDAMRTRTTVRFEAGRRTDTVLLNGQPDAVASARATTCLDLLRVRAGVTHGALVETDNDFPTGAGLASSASGFAALVTAGAAALGLRLPLAEIAAAARLGSGSAALAVRRFIAAQRGRRRRSLTWLPAEAWPLRSLSGDLDAAKT
jgi:diphosphomevalonate decarboxylase